MAHELTSTDGLMLAGKGAWHGLGTIVEGAKTPSEALQIAKLDWTVEQQRLIRVPQEKLGVVNSGRLIEDYVANVRQDTGKLLGIVGKDWTPYQNTELADFCEALHDEGKVVVETAGSIRGGEKVWFLLRGEQFALNKGKDEMWPYILVSNGHGGGTALRCTPTTIRVVCSNTLHAVIPQFENTKSRKIKGLRPAAYVVHHTVGLKARVEEARKALQDYSLRMEENKELMKSLSNVDVNEERIKKFFIEMHQRHFGVIPENPKTRGEERTRDRALEGVARCLNRFEKERPIAGATAWNMFNAYTGMIQHDYESRRKDPEVRRESKLSNNLFGINVDRTIEAFRIALAS